VQIITPLIPSGDEGPLHYLGCVAYPDDADDRDRFIAAGLALAGRASGLKRRELPAAAKALQGGPQRATSIVQTAERRIRVERIATAYAAVQRIEANSPTSIEATLDNWLSLDWGFDAANPLEDTGRLGPPHTDLENARARVWRPSVPVLPMTFALLFRPPSLSALLSRHREGGTRGGTIAFDGPLTHPTADILANPTWVASAVAASRDLGGPLCHDFLPSNSYIYVPRLS